MFKGISSRKDQTAQQMVSLLDFLGLQDTRPGSLSQATYFACLKVLSESMGKMPLRLLQSTPTGGTRAATEHPLYSVLKYRPNNAMTSTGWMSTMEMQRNHYGNAFSLITGSGSATQVIPLDSSKVQIIYDDAKWLSEKPRLWYRYTDTNGQHLFQDYEILHVRTSTSLDGISGLSVQQVLERNFNSMHAAQNTQNNLFTNGLTAKMIVQYTSGLSDENLKEFLKILDKYATGQMKGDATDLAIPIPVGTTLTPLNLKLTDAQFVELKKYSALEIAAAMGIKPNQINDYDKSSYASAEAQQLSFYVDTLLYIIKMYEDEYNYKMLSAEDIAAGYFFRFNFNVLLRADLATQIEALTKAIQNSLYTPNEAREFVDMPALPGGDCLLCNGSMLPVSMAGVQYGGKEGTKDETV